MVWLHMVYLWYYLFYLSLWCGCRACYVLVVQENVRSPHLIMWKADDFDAAILVGIPLEAKVCPNLKMSGLAICRVSSR